MRLVLELNCENEFSIPVHYNYHIQSLLYNSISPKLADILHNKGFPIQGRKFKLFTFSRILGRYQTNNKKGEISFSSPFRLIVSSVLREFIEEIAEELLLKETVRIASQRVSLNSVEVSDFTSDREKLKINMLSPTTIYSTLSRADGRKKTYYYNPFEREFGELISENAKKKFRAFYGNEPGGGIKLTPLKVNNNNEKIITYKNTVIKGWMGTYELSGDRELIKIVYDTGLGGKNPQGFGCFEVLGRNNKEKD